MRRKLAEMDTQFDTTQAKLNTEIRLLTKLYCTETLY